MSLLQEELTGKIREAAFQVHKFHGTGLLESVYERGLAFRLMDAGIPVEQGRKFTVLDYRGRELGTFTPDLLVDGAVIVKIRGVEQITGEDMARLLNQLKVAKVPVGVVINFGSSKLEFRRFVMTK